MALRPHLVWGPGDKNVVPRVLALARKGRLKIIGSGRNKVDVTHITNVVAAHLLAEGALHACSLIDYKPSGAGNPTGKAYFITNGEPVVLWDWINELLRGVGLPEITERVSLGTASGLGRLLETLWRVLPLKGEPPMTRFVAKEMATDHWFDISAARHDLGYAPRFSMAAGTAELLAHYKARNVY